MREELYRWEMQAIGVSHANGNLAIKVRENLGRMPKSEWIAVDISSMTFLKLCTLDFEVVNGLGKTQLKLHSM